MIAQAQDSDLAGDVVQNNLKKATHKFIGSESYTGTGFMRPLWVLVGIWFTRSIYYPPRLAPYALLM